MKTHVDAVLIAVGTEITSGQITNRNTGWLAVPLSEAGLAPLLHWSVPDERSLIIEAITAAAQQSQLVFLTGGLGPTSDDFTRILVAEWAQRELVFSEASWQRVVKLVTRNNFKVAESQKQQCWFPEGAEILPNPEGTADGFCLTHEGTTVVVLPGPPREVAALWQSSLAEKLKPFFPEQVPQTLVTWQCMGIPEASLAEAVDEAVKGFEVDTGYRAHFPYVEVKVWIKAQENAKKVLAALEPILSPWAVLQHGEEAAERFLHHLAAEPLHIIDGATQGALGERLLPVFRKHTPIPAIRLEQYLGAAQVKTQAANQKASDISDLTLSIYPGNTHQYQVQLKEPLNGQEKTFTLDVPTRYDASRSQRYLAEKILLAFPAWLAAVRQPTSSHADGNLSA